MSPVFGIAADAEVRRDLEIPVIECFDFEARSNSGLVIPRLRKDFMENSDYIVLLTRYGLLFTSDGGDKDPFYDGEAISENAYGDPQIFRSMYHEGRNWQLVPEYDETCIKSSEEINDTIAVARTIRKNIERDGMQAYCNYEDAAGLPVGWGVKSLKQDKIVVFDDEEGA